MRLANFIELAGGFRLLHPSAIPMAAATPMAGAPRMTIERIASAT